MRQEWITIAAGGLLLTLSSFLWNGSSRREVGRSLPVVPASREASRAPKQFRNFQPSSWPQNADIETVRAKEFALFHRLIKLGKIEEAEHFLQLLLEKNSEDPAVLAEAGFFSSRIKNQPEQALNYFEKALQKSTNQEGEILFEMVNLYQSHDGERGKRFLDWLSRDKPESSGPPIALGHLYLKTRETREAVRVLESAFRRKEVSDSIEPYLGAAYLESGESRRAVDIFRNVLLERERREPQSLEERELVAKQITWAQLDLAAAHIADKNGTSAREILYAVLQKVPYDRYAQALWERLNRSEIVVQP